MSPVPDPAHSYINNFVKGQVVSKPADPESLILEAWAHGYLVGSLVILMAITVANMRRGVLLHKLILLELFLGLWQGFWLFFKSPIHAWWLSCAAIFLNASWSLHNVISWLKIKPFLCRPVSWIFIGTVVLALPYWVLEIYANFARQYFHGVNQLFVRTRPWEALCRDPWWVFTTVWLFWTIKSQYELTFREIIRISPRFGVMLASMIISIIFIVLDICSVTGAIRTSPSVGINPFWKVAFVFKCLTDAVVLDDFKTALDRLRAFKMRTLSSGSQDTSNRHAYGDGSLVNNWESFEIEERRPSIPTLNSPDGDYIRSSRKHYPPWKPTRKHRTDPDKPKNQKQHKDSVLSGDIVQRDFSEVSDSSVQPEDPVPSAPVDTIARTTELTPIVSEKEEGKDGSTSQNEDHLTAEFHYGLAMKEVSGYSAPSSPTKTNSFRPSNLT